MRFVIIAVSSLLFLSSAQAFAEKTVVDMWLRTPGTSGLTDTRSKVISMGVGNSEKDKMGLYRPA